MLFCWSSPDLNPKQPDLSNALQTSILNTHLIFISGFNSSSGGCSKSLGPIIPNCRRRVSWNLVCPPWHAECLGLPAAGGPERSEGVAHVWSSWKMGRRSCKTRRTACTTTSFWCESKMEVLHKVIWLVLGGDPAARSHRVEQLTAL